MLYDRALPGLGPAYMRFDVTQTPEGLFTLRVCRAEGPGFVTAANSDTYSDLVFVEVCDVVAAVLDGAAAG